MRDGKGVGKGLDEGADKASDKVSGKGSAKEAVTGPDDKLPTSGGTPNATPDGKKQKGRRGTAKGLNAEDKGVVMHLAEVLDADKGQGEGPESKAKAERLKDLVTQAKQVDSKPELAAETTAKLDEAALANASSRPGASKGGQSGNGAKGAKDVTGKDAKGTESPSAEAKPFSVPAEQQAKLAIEWGIKTDDPKFVYAMTSQATLDFFSRLTPEQRTYLSKNKMKKLEVPSESDIAAVKKQIEEKVKEAAEAQKKKEEAERAKQAKAVLDKKHSENKADWAKRKLELREDVRKRVETEMPDYRWEKAFDEIVGVTDEIINKNPTASYDKQVKTAEKKVTADLDQEKKRREVAAIEKKYPNLYSPVMRDLKEKVLADPSMSAVAFEQQVQAARRDQRNPKVEIWAKLLKLKLYQQGKVTPFERLTSREGLEVHYSVDLDGLKLPAVADDTAPDDLLDALLLVGTRYKRLHVTLETGVEAGADSLKLPHRYWARDGQPADYDLFFGAGRPRWKEPGPDNKPPGHTEDEITKGLDDAYTEIRDRLKARAKLVLDNDCHPRFIE